jgi:hypothetical protein
MIVPVKTVDLALMPLGTIFFDELTDTIPYKLMLVRDGRVYCNRVVSQNELVIVPNDYVVYVNKE